MNILLTGATGNLGYELCRALLKRKYKIFLTIREGVNNDILEKIKKLNDNENIPLNLVYCDLEKEELQSTPGVKIDYIIHSAGIVRLLEAGESNENMAKNVRAYAEKNTTPVCHISTAYIYKGDNSDFNNQYEKDKRNAELVFENVSFPVSTVAPSIIIGNSETGEIINFTGYYMVLGSILKVMAKSEKTIRFPKFEGLVNVIPADYVAEAVIRIVEEHSTGYFFAINPHYTSFEKIIGKSLEELGFREKIEFLDCSLEEYTAMDLATAEEKLLAYTRYFMPYWTIDYTFPESIIPHAFDDQKSIQIMTNYYKQHFNAERLEK